MAQPVLRGHPDIPAEVAEKLCRALRVAAGDRLPWHDLALRRVPHLPSDCVYLVYEATPARRARRRGGRAAPSKQVADLLKRHALESGDGP